MQALYLMIPGFLGSLSFSLVGFGPALIFIFFWFLFDQQSALDKTTHLKDAVFLASIVSWTSSSVFALNNYKKAELRLSMYMAFCGVVGVISGIETLRAVGDDVWVKRGIGMCFFIAFILQFQAPSGKSRNADLSDRTDCIALTLGCLSSGFLGGFIGAYGPPLIVVTLLRNFQKATFQPSIAFFLLTFSSVQLLYNAFVWKSTESRLVDCYMTVAISAVCGVTFGHFVQRFVSQQIFRKLLHSLLFIASCSIMSYKLSCSLYVTIGSVCVVILAHTFVYVNNWYSDSPSIEPSNKPVNCRDMEEDSSEKSIISDEERLEMQGGMGTGAGTNPESNV